MASSAIPHDVLYSGSINLTASTFISGISFGTMTFLYLICTYNLVRDLRSTRATRKTALLMAWITPLWVLSSISTIANTSQCIYAYSWQMGYPGGPEAYLSASWDKPMAISLFTSYILTMWLADAVVVSFSQS